MSEEGLFRLKEVDIRYYQADLINEFNLDPTKPVADGYGHFKNCYWFVQEVEGSDIDWALQQVESTVLQLEHSGRNVSAIFIVVENSFKSKKFKSKNGMLYIRGQRNPYLIRGKPVYIVRDRAIKRGEFKWQSYFD